MWQGGACRWLKGVCNRERLQLLGEEVYNKGRASGGSENREQGSGRGMRAAGTLKLEVCCENCG